MSNRSSSSRTAKSPKVKRAKLHVEPLTVGGIDVDVVVQVNGVRCRKPGQFTLMECPEELWNDPLWANQRYGNGAQPKVKAPAKSPMETILGYNVYAPAGRHIICKEVGKSKFSACPADVQEEMIRRGIDSELVYGKPKGIKSPTTIYRAPDGDYTLYWSDSTGWRCREDGKYVLCPASEKTKIAALAPPAGHPALKSQGGPGAASSARSSQRSPSPSRRVVGSTYSPTSGRQAIAASARSAQSVMSPRSSQMGRAVQRSPSPRASQYASAGSNGLGSPRRVAAQMPRVASPIRGTQTGVSAPMPTAAGNIAQRRLAALQAARRKPQ